MERVSRHLSVALRVLMAKRAAYSPTSSQKLFFSLSISTMVNFTLSVPCVRISTLLASMTRDLMLTGVLSLTFVAVILTLRLRRLCLMIMDVSGLRANVRSNRLALGSAGFRLRALREFVVLRFAEAKRVFTFFR